MIDPVSGADLDVSFFDDADFDRAARMAANDNRRPRHIDADDYDGLNALPVIAWIGAMIAMGFFFTWLGSIRI